MPPPGPAKHTLLDGLAAQSIPAMVPLRITAMRSLMDSNSWSSEEIMTIAIPWAASLLDERMNLGFRRHVRLAWARQDETGFRSQPARDRNLLLIPPDSDSTVAASDAVFTLSSRRSGSRVAFPPWHRSAIASISPEDSAG
jgi:hypothetical protein